MKTKEYKQNSILDYLKPEQKSFKAKNKKYVQPKITLFCHPTSVSELTYNPISDYNFVRRFIRQYKKSHSYDAKMSREGLLYIATSDFSQYSVINMIKRTIIVKGSERTLFVESEVASAEVDDNSTLTEILVEKSCRRLGIGTMLIKFINRCCPQFVVCGGTHVNSRYRLTLEGAALINACQRKGILQYNQILNGTVYDSPSFNV